MRKALDAAGFDAGAATICQHLAQRHEHPPFRTVGCRPFSYSPRSNDGQTIMVVMGLSRRRTGRDGRPRYAAYWLDVRGRERSAGSGALQPVSRPDLPRLVDKWKSLSQLAKPPLGSALTVAA